MTISEHFNIDDLLAVCLHFAEEVDDVFGDISKHNYLSCSLESRWMCLQEDIVLLSSSLPVVYDKRIEPLLEYHGEVSSL